MFDVSADQLPDSSALFEFPLDTVASVDDETRHYLRATVAERAPIDDVERASIADFLARYDELDDPLDQRRGPIHVTGSAIVVGSRGVVLLRHKRLGLWLQPGGHIDPGEQPWEAALREAAEETGLAVRWLDLGADGVPPLVHVDVHDGGRGHTHLDLRYLVDGGDADPCPPEGESQQIAWFAWPDAVERASDDRLRALLATLSPNV